MDFLGNVNNYDMAFFLIACLAVSNINPSAIPFIIDNLYERVIGLVKVSVDNANVVN